MVLVCELLRLRGLCGLGFMGWWWLNLTRLDTNCIDRWMEWVGDVVLVAYVRNEWKYMARPTNN